MADEKGESELRREAYALFHRAFGADNEGTPEQRRVDLRTLIAHLAVAVGEVRPDWNDGAEVEITIQIRAEELAGWRGLLSEARVLAVSMLKSPTAPLARTEEREFCSGAVRVRVLRAPDEAAAPAAPRLHQLEREPGEPHHLGTCGVCHRSNVSASDACPGEAPRP